MTTNWPKCARCGITTNDLVRGHCADPQRCVVVQAQREQVRREAIAAVFARLFGPETPSEEFELARVAA